MRAVKETLHSAARRVPAPAQLAAQHPQQIRLKGTAGLSQRRNQVLARLALVPSGQLQVSHVEAPWQMEVAYASGQGPDAEVEASLLALERTCNSQRVQEHCTVAAGRQ